MKEAKEMTQQELQKKIRDMYHLKRDLYANISKCKQVITDANNIIDECEKELRKRGYI